MKDAIDAKSARDLVGRAVHAIAGDAAVKKTLPAVDALFELVRETAMANSAGKRGASFTKIEVSARDADADGGDDHGHAPMTTVFQARTPIDAGPKKRTPIRVGGGTCIFIRVGTIIIIICVVWQS